MRAAKRSKMFHKLDRPFQQATYDRIMASDAKFIILSAAVGSGKSAFAAQACEDGNRVLALVKTKSLQDQYANSYQFASLKGKNAYTCGDWPGFSADDCDDCVHRITMMGNCKNCEEPSEGIYNCKKCGDRFCDYPIARNLFLASPKGALNYTKYLVDKGLKAEFSPDIAFLDECHQLEDITLDFAGIQWQWQNRRLMQYCDQIELDSNVMSQELCRMLALNWLRELSLELKDNEPVKPRNPQDTEQRRARRYWEETTRKVNTTLSAFGLQPECWFVHSDNERITIKPLTARFHFPGLFNNTAPKIVLMSATIPGAKVKERLTDGLYRLDASLYASSLGIYEDYEAFKVPNIWPGPMRPVHDLKGPKLGWKSSPEERADHARLIADKLNELPEHWTGLLHVTSKKMARALGDSISRLTGRPVWIPEEDTGTEKMIASFTDYCYSNPGTIGISYAFSEGIDTGWLNINGTCKVPFTDFSDPYEKARFDYDRAMGLARVANVIEQQQGRNRRGYPEHYGGSAEKYNFICDGNWKRVQNYLSDDFTESVIG